MSKNVLDKTFNNGIWFKGQGLTVRQVLEWAATCDDVRLCNKPAVKQSVNLFDKTVYDYVLKAERGSYRLTEEEYNYYIKRRDFWEQWNKTERPKYSEDIYSVYYKADYDRAYHKTLIA